MSTWEEFVKLYEGLSDSEKWEVYHLIEELSEKQH